MQVWLSGTTDRGGVLWGILCGWLMVFANLVLFHWHTPVFYVVPFDVFAVPVLITLLLRIAGSRAVPS